jgi:hypothetical protein
MKPFSVLLAGTTLLATSGCAGARATAPEAASVALGTPVVDVVSVRTGEGVSAVGGPLRESVAPGTCAAAAPMPSTSGEAAPMPNRSGPSAPTRMPNACPAPAPPRSGSLRGSISPDG